MVKVTNKEVKIKHNCMNIIYYRFSYYTFLNIIEQQAIRIFNPQCKISVVVERSIIIEINMLNNRPDAQMNAYPEFVELELMGLKHINSSPMSIGCNILKKYIEKKTGKI